MVFGNLDQVNSLLAVVGAIVGLCTFVVAVYQYVLQGTQSRASQFIERRKQLKENSVFKEICNLLETDDPKLAYLAFKEKRDFLGFFEEIALMMNSKLIRKGVAYYMFGYYAVRCWQSRNFWINVNRNSTYWGLFAHFAKEMEELERKGSINPTRLKF